MTKGKNQGEEIKDTEEDIYDDDFIEEKKLKVACYIRVSTTDQKERYGPDLQLERIRAYLESRTNNLVFGGKEVSFDDPFVFYDGAVSGADKIEVREEMGRMFDILDYHGKENRPFDVVIVYKIDRFARDLRVLLDISDKLKEYGVGFISTQESIDTSNPFGNAMLGILGVFAELEREMIRERTMLGMLESFKKGIAKKVPYGYRKQEVTKRTYVNKNESVIVEELFNRIELGDSISEICNDLIKRKVLVPTASGSDSSHLSRLTNKYGWEDSTIRKILKNQFYIGKLYYNKSRKVKLKNGNKKTIHLPESEWLLSPVMHAPLVSEDTFKNVQIILGEKKGNFHKSENNYLLAGITHCGYCEKHRPTGGMHWGGTGGKKRPTYHCHGKKSKNHINGYSCPVVQLPKNELEELVIKEIKGIFSNVKILEKYINEKKNVPNIIEKKENDLHRINDKILKAEQALENIKSLGLEGEMSHSEFKTRNDAKKLQLIEYNRELKVIEKSYNKLFNEDKYKKGLSIIKRIVESDIQSLFKNDDETKKFFGFIIDSIYIYSRDKESTDIIRGPSASNQKIPFKMIIKFKLPQEFLREYIKFSTNGK